MRISFTAMLATKEDKSKLTVIYKEYYGMMLKVAKSIISDRVLAEDAVSESILTIIKNLHKIGDVKSNETKAYIVIIVRSRSINILKKQKIFEEESLDEFNLTDNNQTLLDDVIMKESYYDLIQKILSLPALLADTLFLSFVKGHTNEEISRILNVSADTVRQRISRARKQLKKEFMKEGVINARK